MVFTGMETLESDNLNDLSNTVRSIIVSANYHVTHMCSTHTEVQAQSTFC